MATKKPFGIVTLVGLTGTAVVCLTLSAAQPAPQTSAAETPKTCWDCDMYTQEGEVDWDCEGVLVGSKKCTPGVPDCALAGNCGSGNQQLPVIAGGGSR